MAITLRVFWKDMPAKQDWDDLTAWAYEFMGNRRYHLNTHATMEHMDFTLKDEQEATMFQLRCGHARRLSPGEITIDYVGSLIR